MGGVQRVARITPAAYPARAIVHSTVNVTASEKRLLSSSEGWLVDRGFMGSLESWLIKTAGIRVPRQYVRYTSL